MIILLALALQNPVDSYYEAESLPPADDYDFYRRLTLDLTGRLPEPDAIRAFVADTRDDKRARAIDGMLDSDAHAEFFADLWLRALVNYELDEVDPFRISFKTFRDWLVGAVRRDLPYDAFTRELVAGSGDSYDSGAVNFAMKHLRTGEPPIDMTERTVQVFLGAPVQCAQCHDHPFEPISRDQYWSVAAFFKDTRTNIRKTYSGMKYGLKEGAGRDLQIPLAPTGTFAQPKFLDGRAPIEGRTLRESLAEFIVTAESDQFARNYVNRMWAHLMGWGFNTPLDAFGKNAQTRDTALLDSLATSFREDGWSPRRLLRTIVTSKAYRLSCVAPNAEKIKPVKPMSVPQLMNVMITAYNLEPFLKIFYEAFANNPDLPEPYRTPEVFRMYILQYVTDLMVAQREPGDELKTPGSVRLALRFMNNEEMQGAIYLHGSPYMKVISNVREPEARIEELFLATLGRPPRDEERARYLEHLEAGKFRPAAYQDVYWVLLNSSEFFFIH